MNQKACCNKHCITETVKDTFWFVKQMLNLDGLAEKLKADNQMEWVAQMNTYAAEPQNL